MFTQHSSIRRLFAAKATREEKSEESRSTRLLARLGNIKVETKYGGSSDEIDGFLVTDRYP
jgi:hypothetical protein